SVFASWWFISLTITAMLALVFLVTRLMKKEDSYSINLDDEEEDDETNIDQDEEIDDTAFDELEDIEHSKSVEEEIPSNVTPQLRSRTVRSELNPKPVPLKRKRRTRATEDDAIVKVSKRRRLVEDEVKPKVRKRRAVRQSTEVEDVEMSDNLNQYSEN
ncbi:MAG: hypothetical protein L7U53_02995, partial [Candidatus Poseidoniaceae archaeon]|nr:hypothetical protein [Candidatus Poseidoniaceae archaeon]